MAALIQCDLCGEPCAQNQIVVIAHPELSTTQDICVDCFDKVAKHLNMDVVIKEKRKERQDVETGIKIETLRAEMQARTEVARANNPELTPGYQESLDNLRAKAARPIDEDMLE